MVGKVVRIRRLEGGFTGFVVGLDVGGDWGGVRSDCRIFGLSYWKGGVDIVWGGKDRGRGAGFRGEEEFGLVYDWFEMVLDIYVAMGRR